MCKKVIFLTGGDRELYLACDGNDSSVIVNRLVVTGLHSGLNEASSKGARMEGRTQMGSLKGSDTEAFVGEVDGFRGVLMLCGLRENFIKACSVRIVMYSQGHVC
jgi:hypothetical protein